MHTEGHPRAECREGLFLEQEAAAFAGIAVGGAFLLEVSSAIKYGLLERPGTKKLKVSDLAKKILRLASRRGTWKVSGKRFSKARQKFPTCTSTTAEKISRTSVLKIFDNALVDTFHVPPHDKLNEFYEIFYATLESTRNCWKKLATNTESSTSLANRRRPVQMPAPAFSRSSGKDVKINGGDTCFVMQPFASPLSAIITRKSTSRPSVRQG